MSYSSELAELTRTRIDLIEIIADFCDNTYGAAPCTASGSPGEECYNCFAACQDKPNFTKTTKTYQFINANLPLSVVNDYYGAKPYIKSMNELATEIKENDTVVKRLKVEFYDETDNDVGIDPYVSSRSSVRGTFWKKWLARNPNYKGRLIKHYEGFEGLAAVDFSLKFVGKIENIELTSSGVVRIEAADLLKELSKIEYPVKSDKTIVFDVGTVFEAVSETEMTELPALRLDWCKRLDYESMNGVVTPGNGGSGALAAGTYSINLICYDNQDLPYRQFSGNTVVTGSGDGYIDLDWSAYEDGYCNYVGVYARISTGNWQLLGVILGGVGVTTINSLVGGSEQDPPWQAEIYYVLNGDDPTDAGNWDMTHAAITIEVSSGAGLTVGGMYIKIDDEIIYCEYDSTAVLTNVRRAQFNTDAERHDAGTSVHLLYWYHEPDNPFTILLDILDKAGIDSAYIDSNFATLEAAWSDIDFMTQPIVKGKLSEIYFDLVNTVDCMSWVGEDGKIKIKEHSDTSGTIPTLTEDANFIGDSVSVDLNEESRKTRWIIYWNRFKADGSITDEENYNMLNIGTDTVAESADEYNDQIEDIITSTWLNLANDVPADVNTYAAALVTARKNRMRDAQTIINGSVELKDAAVITGQLVDVSTSKIQDKNGNAISAVRYRVIKKEIRGNKIDLKLIKVL